jgi:hypothetical protein
MLLSGTIIKIILALIATAIVYSTLTYQMIHDWMINRASSVLRTFNKMYSVLFRRGELIGISAELDQRLNNQEINYVTVTGVIEGNYEKPEKIFCAKEVDNNLLSNHTNGVAVLTIS